MQVTKKSIRSQSVYTLTIKLSDNQVSAMQFQFSSVQHKLETVKQLTAMRMSNIFTNTNSVRN